MILYLIKSSICLALLLGAYRLFLEKEKMHRFNRFFLLFSLIFSFTIPLLPVGLPDSPFTGFMSSAAPVAETAVTSGSQETSATAVQSKQNETRFTTIFLLQSLILTSGLITTLLLLRLIFKVDSIYLRVKRRPSVPWKGSIIVLLKEKTAPFSFMNYIFLNEEEYRAGKIRKEVIVHEYAHVRQRHTLDILFLEVIKAFFWFHPLLYLYKSAIQLNHEFQADEAVLSKTNSITGYQKLLLQMLQSEPSVSLSSRFSFPLTKKRLFMMTKKGSRGRLFTKQLLLLPMIAGLALLLGTAAAPFNQQNSDRPVSIDIGSSEGIVIQGERIHHSHLERRLYGMGNAEDRVFELIISDGAHMKEVLSVVSTINQYTPFILINPSSSVELPDLNEMEKLSQLVNEFVIAAKKYTSMNSGDTPKNELQQIYNNLMINYNAILEKQDEIFPHKQANILPPPPMPSGE